MIGDATSLVLQAGETQSPPNAQKDALRIQPKCSATILLSLASLAAPTLLTEIFPFKSV